MADTIPAGSVPISATVSGTTGAINTSLGTTANVGRTIYVTGFTYQATGATAATTVTIQLAYVPASGSAIIIGQWTYPIGAGAGSVQVPLDINLIPPMQASQSITGLLNSSATVGSVSIGVGAAGAGATFAGLNIWGYML